MLQNAGTKASLPAPHEIPCQPLFMRSEVRISEDEVEAGKGCWKKAVGQQV